MVGIGHRVLRRRTGVSRSTQVQVDNYVKSGGGGLGNTRSYRCLVIAARIGFDPRSRTVLRLHTIADSRADTALVDAGKSQPRRFVEGQANRIGTPGLDRAPVGRGRTCDAAPGIGGAPPKDRSSVQTTDVDASQLNGSTAGVNQQ